MSTFRCLRSTRSWGAALAATALLALPVLAACGSEPPAQPGEGTAPLRGEAALGPAAGPGPGFSYDPAAPEGATLSATLTPAGSGTTASLNVQGLQPNRGYAAHAHDNPCGPTGDDAGPHFQNQVDPAAGPGNPSVDAAFANPQNEFWLDLQTDGSGSGSTTVTVPFGFTDRQPGSVIIHEEMMTSTEPGMHGSAGGRLACLTIQ